jgi:hypothetical protein
MAQRSGKETTYSANKDGDKDCRFKDVRVSSTIMCTCAPSLFPQQTLPWWHCYYHLCIMCRKLRHKGERKLFLASKATDLGFEVPYTIHYHSSQNLFNLYL